MKNQEKGARKQGEEIRVLWLRCLWLCLCGRGDLKSKGKAKGERVGPRVLNLSILFLQLEILGSFEEINYSCNCGMDKGKMLIIHRING